MDSEEYNINQATADMVNKAKLAKKRVCAIGTTSMRAIETAVTTTGQLKESGGWTNKFIFPPYDFKVANCMITNFHMSQSTLFMMTCAFGGYDLIMQAYKTAVKEKYGFYSYGDAMLII